MSMTLLAAGGWLQALIVQLAAFALLAALLGKFVVPLLAKMLKGRTQGIQDTYDRIRKETDEAQAKLAEMKERLAAFDREAERRRREAAEEADRMRTQALADAKAQAEAIVEKARKELEIERSKAVLEIAERAVALVRETAEHVASSAMTEDLQKKLVDGYIRKLDSVVKP